MTIYTVFAEIEGSIRSFAATGTTNREKAEAKFNRLVNYYTNLYKDATVKRWLSSFDISVLDCKIIKIPNKKGFIIHLNKFEEE